MKKLRFTEIQMVWILQEADSGIAVNEIWRKHGINAAAYYKWKAKYGGLDIPELVRAERARSGKQPAQAHVCESCAGE